MIAFDGAFHDGRTARAVPVRVEVDGDDATVCDGVVAGRIRRAGFVADAPIPGVLRTLRLPGGESIETADHAAVAALWPERGAVARLAYALESRWPSALAAIAATAAFVWLVVAIVLPGAADPVARRISPDVERRLGEHALEALDRLALKPSQLSTEEQDAWEAKFKAFVAGEPGAERYAIVFRGARRPNAFALPGGTIVVTDAMIRAAGSDDELSAVLAHEIGHVRGRHALRLVLQDSGIAVLATALAGDAAGVTFLAVALPSMLLQSRYSREFEAEADEYAFAHLKRHGVSPQAFADVMRRLAKEEGATGSDDAVGRWLGSHPATEERIRRAEEAR